MNKLQKGLVTTLLSSPPVSESSLNRVQCNKKQHGPDTIINGVEEEEKQTEPSEPAESMGSDSSDEHRGIFYSTDELEKLEAGPNSELAAESSGNSDEIQADASKTDGVEEAQPSSADISPEYYPIRLYFISFTLTNSFLL